MPLPTSYRSNKNHPLIPFDNDCAKCKLGELRQEHNKRVMEEERDEHLLYAIGGAGPDDLSKVRLIVISDYPGPYEVKYGYPMYDRTLASDYKPRVRGLVQPKNAGAILRYYLSAIYGLDTYNEVYITNGIKCNPAKVTVDENSHAKRCAGFWLAPELAKLDLYCPAAPILCCGSHAYKTLRAAYPFYRKDFEALGSGYNSCRRKIIMLDQHPTTATFNPAVVARSIPRIDTNIKTSSKGVRITENEVLEPIIPFSPLHKFLGDLFFLQSHILPAKEN